MGVHSHTYSDLIPQLLFQFSADNGLTEGTFCD